LALRWRFSVLTTLAILGTTILPLSTGEAKVFHSKQEALTLAFPDADKVDTRTFFLTEEQVQRIATLATTPVESKLVTVYVGQKNGEVLGYGFIETNIVRTLPETFLIVVSPTGSIQKLFVLAFYEPEEYLPAERWLRQFDQKALNPDLQLRRDIYGIAGATLTSRAVTSGVRKVLAFFQVLFQEGKENK
jgi:hypothetical protein